MSRDTMHTVIFFSIVTTIMGLSVFYLGTRVTGPLQKDSPCRVVIWSLLIILTVLQFAIPILLRTGALTSFETIHPDLTKVLMLVVYGFMGFLAMIIFFLLAADIVEFIWKVIPGERIDPSKRALIFNYGPWGVFGITTFLAGWGAQMALSGAKVIRVKVPITGLSPSLRGFKIAQISDLHVGSTIKKNYVSHVVDAIMAEKPDLIAVTGDLADGHPDRLIEEISPLSKLRAPHGVFYVTGNHEYYWGAKDWIKKAEELGFQLMLNKHKMIQHGNSKVVVAGVPDPTFKQYLDAHGNNPTELTELPTADFTLFLAHQPSAYKTAEKIGANLQLSGHTHAGQFYPIRFVIGFFHRYYQGLNKHSDKLWIYVNQGTGYWGPPNRLGIPAEITLLELTETNS